MDLDHGFTSKYPRTPPLFFFVTIRKIITQQSYVAAICTFSFVFVVCILKTAMSLLSHFISLFLVHNYSSILGASYLHKEPLRI